MQHKFFTIALLSAAISLSLLSPIISQAQSMPAGQTSRRMANAPAQSEAATATIIDSILHPKPPAAGIFHGFDLVMSKSTSKQAADDQSNLDDAKGAASHAVWQKMVDMDSQYPNPYLPNALAAARSVASAVSDSLALSAAKKVVLAAKCVADTKFGTADTDSIHAATQEIVDAIDNMRCGYNTPPANPAPDPTASAEPGAKPAPAPGDDAVVTPANDSDASTTSASSSPSPAATAKKPSGKVKPKKTTTASTPDLQFEYRNWFPLLGPGCTDAAILNFFSVNNATETATNALYLYNAQQSASQVNAQLLTATFAPGLQAVLSGTATSGSGSTSSSTTTGSSSGAASGTSSGSSTTTDSVATAVAKIEAGGDFNIKFPAPVFLHQGKHGSTVGYFSPNVGFNINGISGQSTITQGTEYSVNIPLELYMQSKSIDPTSNAVPSATVFLDLKPAAELISSDLAQKIQLTSSRGFFLGQAAIGIEFSSSVRLSFQYIYGPNQIYQGATSTGTSTTGTSTTPTSRIGGFHLAVSFSPQKSKPSGQ
jgi:hypothetical protein